MRIHTLIITAAISFIGLHSMAQSEQPEKYRKFSIYGGAGPSYFFNNLILFKNDVSPFNYAFSVRFMWEPQHSFLSLGFETGYYRLYTASSTVTNGAQTTTAEVKNSSIPIQIVVSMKFSPKIYANWSMGQSILISKVDAPGTTGSFNSQATSLADFSATLGYRFIQKARISYAAEFKGYYSSGYANGTIALFFIVGYKL
jgi:hypothetical protein